MKTIISKDMFSAVLLLITNIWKQLSIDGILYDEDVLYVCLSNTCVYTCLIYTPYLYMYLCTPHL